jgi:hypothetical protein
VVRVNLFDKLFERCCKPESGHSFRTDDLTWPLSSDDSEDDDEEGNDSMFEEPNPTCQQLQEKFPIDDRIQLLSLRPTMKKLETLLPREVQRHDRSRRDHRRFPMSPNHGRSSQSHYDAPHTNSDDSMCSMEQDNYLRKNMGKRRPSRHHRTQKIICKKTIIKKYLCVSSHSPHSYRQSVPFYATPSPTPNNRRRQRKFNRNRVISDSETDTSSTGPSRKRWKRGKGQVSPGRDNMAKMRNFSIVLERLKPSEDVNLETLLNIGKAKTAPLTPKSCQQKKPALPMKTTNAVRFKAVSPPRPPMVEKPVDPEPENTLCISPDIDVGAQINRSGEQQPPTLEESTQEAESEPEDVIVISDEASADEISFEDYRLAGNQRRQLNQEPESDDYDIYQDYSRVVVSVRSDLKD